MVSLTHMGIEQTFPAGAAVLKNNLAAGVAAWGTGLSVAASGQMTSGRKRECQLRLPDSMRTKG
jgi:ABC-type uncharacterized transport system permease subunit